jgi:NAD-dependent DNA ligase
MWSTNNRNPEVMRALLVAGADVNAEDKNGSTALYWARLEKNAQAVTTLIEAGADDVGQTALTLAEWAKNNPDAIAAIANAGADGKGNQGGAPLEPAPKKETSGTVNAPIEADAQRGDSTMQEERGTVTMSFGLEVGTSGNVSLSLNANEQGRQQHIMPQNFPPTILFTGFKAADRARLEKLATDHQFAIRKSVSHGLAILVAGSNAGPAKLADAKQEGATVLSEAEFMKLMDTGELP